MKAETKARIEAGDYPKRGSRWVDKWWPAHAGEVTVRVLTAEPIDGYIAVRKKGSPPFLVHLSDWDARFAEWIAALNSVKEAEE